MRDLRSWLGLAALLVLLAWLYRPALGFDLVSDDYQWLSQAHAAAHEPLRLLADLDTFYRPTTTWTLVTDHALWGHHARGYRRTSVALHALAAAALALAARRLGLRPWTALAAATRWACSPLTSEPPLSVAIRFDGLLLLAWLALVLLWPRPGASWSRARLAAALGATLFAALSKETWVVTPALAFGLERWLHRGSWKRCVAAALVLAAPVAAYVGLYFALFPGDKGYFEASVAPAAKVPHALAVFAGIEELAPAAFPLGLRGAGASLAVLLALRLGARSRPAPAAVGALLLLLPFLPVLLVPVLPLRHLYVPFAGFLLVAAAAVEAALARLAGRLRSAALGALGLLVAVVLPGQCLATRLEVADAEDLARAHHVLLAEARAVAARFPLDRPVLFVRDEDLDPLAAAAARVRGLRKTYFVRSRSAYGLADTAAVFEWVLAREDLRLAARDVPDGTDGARGALLVHRPGRFEWPSLEVPDVGELYRELAGRGYRPRVFRAVPLE